MVLKILAENKMTDFWEMMDAETISLMLIGVAAIFGLQNSMAMAMRHHLFRNLSGKSPCDRLLVLPRLTSVRFRSPFLQHSTTCNDLPPPGTGCEIGILRED